MSSMTAPHNKSIVPDVPTIINGSMNGTTNPAQSAVTFAGGMSMAGAKSTNIQFGFPQSPAMAVNTPHAPVDAVPSPQMPPSPIPQPSKSGGVPGSIVPGNVPTGVPGNGRPQFGMMLGADDHHAQNRGGFTPQQTHASLTTPSHGHPSPQADVNASLQGGPHNRSGYNNNNNRRGNSFNSGHNNSPRFSQAMHHQYGPGSNFQPGQNRGTMAPAFTPSRPPFNPSQQARSPAMVPAMPVSTPTMNQATMMNMNGNPPFHYPAVGHHGHQMAPVQQVQPPFFAHKPPLGHNDHAPKNKKKFKNRSHDTDKLSRDQSYQGRDSSPAFGNGQELGSGSGPQRQRRNGGSKPGEFKWSGEFVPGLGKNGVADEFTPQSAHQGMRSSFPIRSPYISPPDAGPIDLSPESGNFERKLMESKQPNNAGYPPYMQHSYYTPQHVYNPNPAGFQSQFHPQQPHFQPATHMSRQSSHSERPNSSASNQQQVQPPVVVSSQPSSGMGAPATPSSSNFVRPKRTSAITIKNPQGVVVDLSTVMAPSSPVPTPPSGDAASAPPAKAPAPQHAKTESVVKAKTTKEIQDELREKVGMLAGNKDKSKSEAPSPSVPEKAPQEAAPEPAAEPTAVEAAESTKPSEAPKETPAPEPSVPAEPETVSEQKAVTDEVPAAPKPEVTKVEEPKVEEPKVEEPKVEEPKVEEPKVEEPKVEEPKVEEPAAASAEEPAKSEPEPVKSELTKSEPIKSEPAKSESAAPAESEDDEMECIIREMEEAEAKREQEEEAHRVKREAEKKAEKEKAAANKNVSAAEADRKLREAEREMERLEEEKERKRNQRDAAGGGASFADMLAKARSGADLDASEAQPEKGSDVSDALSTLKISEAKPADGHKATAQRAAKPAALNLKTSNASTVEPPQPSAALQSLKSARFLTVIDQNIYPAGIHSPNPALNAAVTKKGKTFKYDAGFLLQFQKVFTEQPSLEFGQQVKSLIGDGEGRSNSSKGSATGYSRTNSRSGGNAMQQPMGAFGALGSGRGPSSGMGSSHIGGRPPVGGPLAFGSGKPFGGSSMSRNTSQAASVMPHSPSGRQPSGRQGTRNRDRKPADQAKMPITQGQDIKPLQMSGSGWKPLSISNKAAPAPTGHLDPEMVQRKVKAALNKMTPEKFDKITTQILEIAAQSKNETDGRTLRQVIQLTFEKATDEAHWAGMYAQFCRRMLDQMDHNIRDENIRDKYDNVVSGGALFRKYLLNRCQEEFERGWTTQLPDNPAGEDGQGDGKTGDGKSGEAVMLSDEYYIAAAAKRRGLGLVQFIGELFKLQMLTERIMHECVRKLVDFQGIPDEAEVESLTKLLRTIGANLDSSEKGRPVMDAYFDRINMMIRIPDLQSRFKFMLMDIVDLRKHDWVSKETNKGPKTLDQVRLEAEAQQAAKALEAARSSQRGPGTGRAPMGRQDARGQFPGGYPQQQQMNTQVAADDLRRLKGTISRSSVPATFGGGGSSMFGSRNNSGRKTLFGSSSRHGDDSSAPSRAGTPAGQANSFGILAQMDPDNNLGSPPSVNASPALVKATPDTSADDSKKSE